MKNTLTESDIPEIPDIKWVNPTTSITMIPEVLENLKNMSPQGLDMRLMMAEEQWKNIKGINEIRDLVAGKIGTLGIEGSALAINLFINRYKDNDWLVLPDEALLQALAKETPLSKVEFKALLDSPMTLKRMKYIESLRNQYSSAQAVRDFLSHQKWLHLFRETWGGPNYKKPEVAERLLGKPLTFVQIEYILDNTNEESSLGIAIQLENLYAEYGTFVKSNPQDSERIAEYSRQYRELEELIPERVEIYVEHLIRTGWFTPDEIWVLIDNGVLLSRESLSNWIYGMIQEELKRVSSVKWEELGS